jgi:transposase
MQRIVGYTQVGAVSYQGHDVIYTLEPQASLYRCPVCDSPHVSTRGAVKRRLRGVPVGHVKNVLFDVSIPKVHCPKCQHIRQIDPKISNPKKCYTKAFEREVIGHALMMTLQDVAVTLGADWHTVNDILQGYLEKKYSKTKLKGIRRIAIDETSYGRRHKYLTVVMNLDTGEPVFVGEGKSEKALIPFWELLGRRKKRIEVVAIDMGLAFQKAVRENLPNATVVFDRFHVVKLVNTGLDQLRRQVFANATKEQQGVLRGCKYLFLKNEDNLDHGQDEDKRLKLALDLNTPLTQAYILKEALRQLWEKDNYENASACLDGWVALARATRVKILERLANTIERFKEGILNYYKFPVTSGPIEGLNNKIKVLIRRAYGFRNLENLKRLIRGIKSLTQGSFLGVPRGSCNPQKKQLALAFQLKLHGPLRQLI